MALHNFDDGLLAVRFGVDALRQAHDACHRLDIGIIPTQRGEQPAQDGRNFLPIP